MSLIYHTMFNQLSLSWVGAPLITLLAATFSFFFLRRAPPKKPNQLPSPPSLPLIGNLHQLGSLAHRSLTTLSERYGPVMLLWLGCVPTVIVSSAAGAQQAMKTRDLAFSSRPYSSLSDRLLYGSQDIGFSKYGDKWRQMRRVCVVHLLSLQRVHSFRSVREEEVACLVDSIRAASSEVNVSNMMIALTGHIICRVAFGRKYTEEGDGGSRIHSMMSEIAASLGAFPLRDFIPWLGWIDWLNGLDGKVRRTAMEFDAFIEKVLEEHETKRRGKHDQEDSSMDLVDILISLHSTDGSDGTSLTRDNIKAMILDMFVGGTDTSYVTMEWVMAELIKRPTEMKRVQAEIRRVVGSKEKVGEEVVEGMQYLKAVIKETLRLHPPLPLLIPRETVEDTQLLGHHIPQGTRVMINAWAIGRDPVSWEKPEEFRPERFLDSSIDFMGQDFQFIPFGAGRRGCPGIGFAIPTIELALANLLYHFDWELPNGMRGEEMDMSESAGITVEKKSSLILVGKPVNQ